MSFFTTGEAAREIHRLSHLCENNNNIEPELYEKYDVKRGLREKNGKGVLTGLTEISTVNGSKQVDGKLTPIPGELRYRGIKIDDLETWIAEKIEFLINNSEKRYEMGLNAKQSVKKYSKEIIAHKSESKHLHIVTMASVLSHIIAKNSSDSSS